MSGDTSPEHLILDPELAPDEPATPPAPTGHSKKTAGILASPWAFPVVLVMLVAVLGMCKVSQSSVGMYAPGGPDSAEGLVLGEPRAIRSDEWLVRTPMAVRQDSNDLASTYETGVGEHSAALLGELPKASWQTILAPQTIYYQVLGLERAFSFEWLTWMAVLSVGVYALLYALTRRVGLSVFASVMTLFAPVTQWWTISASFTIIGYASLGSAALIWAVRNANVYRRLGLSALSGWLLACSINSFYLPWIVGVFVALIPVVLATVIADTDGLGSPMVRGRRIAEVAVVAGVISLALLGALLVANGDAADAMVNTVYPGQRTSEQGGGIDATHALGAPFDWFASGSGALAPNGNNQSENSSGLALYLVVGLCAVAFADGRRRWRGRFTEMGPLIGAGIGAALLAGWLWLPIPPWMGFFVGLNRVPATRTLFPLSFAGVVVFTLMIAEMRRRGRWLSTPAIVTVTASFALVHSWAVSRYTLDNARVDMRVAFVLLLVASLGIGLSIHRRFSRAGIAVLAVFTIVLGLRINPIQVGLAPLLDAELRVAMEDLGAEDPDATWAIYGDDAIVRGIAQSSERPTLGGVSHYPVDGAWELLDVEGDDDGQWNRYALVVLHDAPTTTGEIAFTVPVPDTVVISVDPCDARLESVDVRFVVAPTTMAVECGTRVDTVNVGAFDLEIYDLETVG